MNFVVFSYSFPPRNGPECFCTARFASALALAGHHVHVVTMDHAKHVDDSVYDFLVDPRIVVTRVPLAPVENRMWGVAKHLSADAEGKDVPRAVSELKKVLGRYDSPVLVSRSNPLVSTVVAWHCRKLASKWIAHFSDPIPFGLHYEGTLVHRLRRWMTMRWCRRAMMDADAISVTCSEVFRFYDEVYGECFKRVPKFVTPHIGDPVLPAAACFNRDWADPLIVHSGMLNLSRGPKQILGSIHRLNSAGFKCKFIQVGQVPPSVNSLFEGGKAVELLAELAPEKASAVVASADVVLISDVQVDWGYVPFMPSKFVYQLFTDKPIVAYTRPNSPMWRVANEFPDCGVFAVDSECPETLDEAIKMACRSKNFDRSAVRKIFSRQEVARNFVTQVSELDEGGANV